MKKTALYLRTIAVILVLTLIFSFGLLFAKADTITDITPKIGKTGNIDGYDVSNSGNLYVTGTPTDNRVVDAQLENSGTVTDTGYFYGKEAKDVVGDYSAEGVTAHSGSKCAKITEKTMFTLPAGTANTQNNTYYVLSFYVYTKNPVPTNGAWSTRFTYRDQVTTGSSFFFGDTDYSDVVLNKWSKVSFVIYTGKRSQYIKMIFAQSGRFNADTVFYIDDFSLIALPNDVQAAAKAFDEYGEITSYDTELADKVGTVFESDTYSALSSPVKKGTTYASMYNTLAGYNPDRVIEGDVNGDTKVDLIDLVHLKKYLANVQGIEVVARNVNLDDNADEITAGDLAVLKTLLLSL